MHKKRYVQRAGEAGEQARALGVGKGSAYLAKSCLPGAHFRGASNERAGKSPPEWRWLRLVGDMTLRGCGVADMAGNGGAAGRYRTTGNDSAVPSDHFGVSSKA
ncbi:TPA: hypothetical protein MH337_18395 [Klebsiella pneumoniae]|nr:hypothetical protein [Klebsiella pneumoniae]